MNKRQRVPRIALIGTGVIGREILRTHLDAGVPVTISDIDANALQHAAKSLSIDPQVWDVAEVDGLSGALTTLAIRRKDNLANTDVQDQSPPIVIESIAERLDIKRQFFGVAETRFGGEAVLCTNTSTLRVQAIAEGLKDSSRLCGMHFFMPVTQRPAVEIVRTEFADDSIISIACQHAERIGKRPLVVMDGPGFLVNRLLSPYLNQSLLLLGRGVNAINIQDAATEFGMPMSPLELIDWIGVRTMFNAGRVFWQSYPKRIDPSPIVPALIKGKRTGRETGKGLYDYPPNQRSENLAVETIEIIERYQKNALSLNADDVVLLLAVPMWIEAALAFRDGVGSSTTQLDMAMSGGLGYEHEAGWTGFFNQLGSSRILQSIDKWSSEFASMRCPDDLIEALKKDTPTDALQSFLP